MNSIRFCVLASAEAVIGVGEAQMDIRAEVVTAVLLRRFWYP